MKRLLVTSIGLFLTIQLGEQMPAAANKSPYPASRMTESMQKWNQLASTAANGGGRIGGETPFDDPTVGNPVGRIGDETPSDDPTVGNPVGNAWTILLILTGIYAITVVVGQKYNKSRALYKNVERKFPKRT